MALREEFSELFELFSEAVGVLNLLCQKVLEAKEKSSLYMTELINSLTVNDFTDLGWERVVSKKVFEEIRPR